MSGSQSDDESQPGEESQPGDEFLLQVRDLKAYFDIEAGEVRAVDGVTYSIRPGKTLGVVGESGCGKSVTAMSILQLLARPPARYAGGSIAFKGRDLLQESEDAMRKVRGNEISMIFQEPMTSLNPVFRVGDQIGEALRLHRGLSKSEARKLTIDALTRVGIPSPEDRVDDYPHQMSGGMKQRVMIAMALACDPELLIADEPTTALDVTIQAQILELLRELQASEGMAILLITHDLGVIAEMADEVVVMYAGKVVEQGPVERLFLEPEHPYTAGLFNSLPRPGHEQEKLQAIEGSVPNPLDFPPGCKFWPRCPYADESCRTTEPELKPIREDQKVACHRVGEFEPARPFSDVGEAGG